MQLEFCNYNSVSAVNGRSYSYEELRKLCGRFATSLRRNNLGPGDTLAIILPNIPEYAIASLGASEAGMMMTLISPALTVYEMSQQIIHSEAAAVITTQEIYSMIVDTVRKNPKHLPLIVVPNGNESISTGAINFTDLVSDGIDEFEKIGEQSRIYNENDTVILPYSSGTTGLPKGVELSHRNIIANIVQASHKEYDFDEPAIGEHQEIIPGFLPFYHIYGFVGCLLKNLRIGGKIICVPQFTSNIFLDVLDKNRSTVLYVAPPIVQLMTTDNRFNRKHMECVKCVVSGAAPTGTQLITKLYSKVNLNFHFGQAYGLTETSPMISRSKKSPWDSSGLIAVNTELRIVSEDDDKGGKNLGINETGEIVVKGPQVMKGYYKNPKGTEDCMDGNWFKTGDSGYIDDKGQLFITGRLKELIKVKGLQVAPAELENLIFSHDKVEDVAVIGTPHVKWGEVPKAFVVPKSGIKITEEDIKNYVAQRLSKYKHLHHVEFIDKIPKSAAGKILRKELSKV
uniref:4CL3_0 protein n=1 Tax=Fopius arisanus TaxID=64838 RepID=A0A0C9RGF5_9HYME